MLKNFSVACEEEVRDRCKATLRKYVQAGETDKDGLLKIMQLADDACDRGVRPSLGGSLADVDAAIGHLTDAIASMSRDKDSKIDMLSEQLESAKADAARTAEESERKAAEKDHQLAAQKEENKQLNLRIDQLQAQLERAQAQLERAEAEKQRAVMDRESELRAEIMAAEKAAASASGKVEILEKQLAESRININN